MSELLKCPFCGGKGERKTWKNYRKIKGKGQTYLATVGCSNYCTAQVSQAAFTVEDAWKYAEEHWNRRVSHE